MEERGKIKLPFKRVILSGDYKSPIGSENKIGRCLRRAIREAMDVDVENLPDVVDSADLPKICTELGLVFHTGSEQKVTLPRGKDVIVLYQTRDNMAHAIVTNRLHEPEKRKRIVGIIEVPNKSSFMLLLSVFLAC